MKPTGELILMIIIAAIWIIGLYAAKRDSDRRYAELNKNIDYFMMKKLKCSKPSTTIIDPFENSHSEPVCFNGRTTYYLDDSLLNQEKHKASDYEEELAYYSFVTYFLNVALLNVVNSGEYKKVQKAFEKIDRDFNIKASSEDESTLYNELVDNYYPNDNDYTFDNTDKRIKKLYSEFRDYISLSRKNRDEFLTEAERKQYEKLEKKFYVYYMKKSEERYRN